MKHAKRIFGVFVAVVTLLATLSVGGVVTSAAGTLSANWEYLPLTNAKGLDAASRSFPINGTFSVGDDGTFFIGSPTWTGNGVTTVKKLPFTNGESISVTVIPGEMTYESTAGHGLAEPYQNAAVSISTDKPQSCANGYTSKLFYDNGISVKMIVNGNNVIDYYVAQNGVALGSSPTGFTTAKNSEVTITFERVGATIRVKASENGGAAVVLGTASNNVGLFNNGCYLAFSADAYGAAYVPGMAVLSVNGVAPNDFSGFISSPEVDALTPVDVDNAANVGRVTATRNTVVIDNDVSAWWPMAGFAIPEKVTLDGLSVKMKVSKGGYETPNEYIGAFISADKPTAMSTNFFVRTYGPDIAPTSGFGITFYGTGQFLNIITGGVVELTTVDTVLENSSFVLSFRKSGDLYLVAIDGTVLTDEATSEPVAVDLSAVTDADGKVWLSFAGCGYGTSPGAVGTVFAINGLTMDRFSAERQGRVVGAQIRTTGEQGLRFLCDVYRNDNYGSITEYGFLMMPRDLLDRESDLVITANGKITSAASPAGVSYLRIVGEKLYRDFGDRIQFTGVILGIPAERYARAITAVGYVVYSNGETVYTNALSRSVNYVETFGGGAPTNYNVTTASGLGDRVTAESIGVTTANAAETNSSALAAYFNSLAATDMVTLCFSEGTYNLGKNTNVTFPANVALLFENGAILNFPNNIERYTFKMKTIIAPENTRVFNFPAVDTGSEQFDNIPTVEASWFGAITDDGVDDSAAIAAAYKFSGGGGVRFCTGTYDVDSTITIDCDALNCDVKNLVFSGGDYAGASEFTGDADPLIEIYDAASGGLSAFFYRMQFRNTSQSVTGIAYYGKHNAFSRLDCTDCIFNCLEKGLYFEYSGGCTFTRCDFISCEIGADNGQYSMFIYYVDCEAHNCGTVFNCIVGPSGGVSNGIMIYRCSAYNCAKPVYITENQAVYVVENTFEECTDTAVTLYKCCDSRVDGNIITAKANSTATTSKYGVFMNTSYGRESVTDNSISGFYQGVRVAMSSNTLVVMGNEITHYRNCGIYASGSDVKIFRNTVIGAAVGSARPIGSGSRTNTLICQNVFDCAYYTISGSGIIGNNTFADGIH